MPDITDEYTQLRRYALDLIAFAVVAQHGQLSSAAQSLQLSQPGLSKRIKHLEDCLRSPLFARNNRGVSLSAAGSDLMRQVGPHLAALADSFKEYRQQKQNPNVLISVDYAFASYWLLPRLAALREMIHPIDISILASQDPAEAKPTIPDLVVRMGDPGRDKSKETKLVGERVSAICSPAFLRRFPNLSRPEDLLGVPLLSLSSASNGSWYDWESWLRTFELDRASGLVKTSFNTYDLVIQAALDGHGVALGWHGLIDDKLKDGSLVTAIEHVAKSGRGYFLSLGKKQSSLAARQVHDWMIGLADRDG